MPLVSYPEVKKKSALPVFVTGVGVGYSQLAVTHQTFSGSQILISVSGCGTLTVGESRYDCPAGCGFYLGHGVDYRYEPRKEFVQRSRNASLDDQWTVDWLSFGFSYDLFESELFTKQSFVMFRFRDPASVSASIRKIRDALENDSEYGEFGASAILYSLLIDLNRETLSLPAPAKKKNPAIDAVMKYIDDNYTTEITLGDLCEVAGGISEQYLCRLFKQNTGERPIEYILHKRISMARSYLEKTDMPIPDVAKLTGFHNTSYFYRNFKKFTGISPLGCRHNALVKGESFAEV